MELLRAIGLPILTVQIHLTPEEANAIKAGSSYLSTIAGKKPVLAFIELPAMRAMVYDPVRKVTTAAPAEFTAKERVVEVERVIAVERADDFAWWDVEPKREEKFDWKA